MIDIQMVACFNTRSPILHLFLLIQCQIHNTHFRKVHSNLRFIRHELLRELYSPRNRKNIGTQPIIELFSPCKS